MAGDGVSRLLCTKRHHLGAYINCYDQEQVVWESRRMDWIFCRYPHDDTIYSRYDRIGLFLDFAGSLVRILRSRSHSIQQAFQEPRILS